MLLGRACKWASAVPLPFALPALPQIEFTRTKAFPEVRKMCCCCEINTGKVFK